MLYENYSVDCREMSGKLTYNGQPIVEYLVQYPHVLGKGESIRRANQLFSHRAGVVINNMRAYQQGMAMAQYRELWRISSFEPLYTSMSSQTMYQREDVFSSFCDVFYNNRCKGTKLYRESFTFSLKNGQLLPIWSFFKSLAWQKTLVAEVCCQIKAIEQDTPGSFYTDWHKHIGQMGGYYLTDEGMAIYYPCGLLSSNAGGLPTFIIPYSRLEHLLAMPL